MSNIHPAVVDAMRGDAEILAGFGFEVLRAQAGVCEMLMTVPSALINAGGYAHGALSYALLDTAAAYALRSAERAGVTSNGNISYVKAAAANDRLLAEVSVASIARRVATLRGEVWLLGESGQRQIAAHGSFVFQLRS